MPGCILHRRAGVCLGALFCTISLLCDWGQRPGKKEKKIKKSPSEIMVVPTDLYAITLLPVAAQYNFPLRLLFRSSGHGGVSDSQIYKFTGNTCSSFKLSHTYTDLFPSERLPGTDLSHRDLIDLSHPIVYIFCTVTVDLYFFVLFGTTLAWVTTCPLFASLHKSIGSQKRMQQWWRVSNESCLQWLLSPCF